MDELLELSRIGRKINPTERVNLVELVRNAIETVSGHINEYGAIVTVDPCLPEVMVDRRHILQVYENRFRAEDRREAGWISYQAEKVKRALTFLENSTLPAISARPDAC